MDQSRLRRYPLKTGNVCRHARHPCAVPASQCRQRLGCAEAANDVRRRGQVACKHGDTDKGRTPGGRPEPRGDQSIAQGTEEATTKQARGLPGREC